MRNCFFRSLALCGALALPLHAQVEDDRENDTPSGTYWNTGVSEAQINTLIGQGWRLTNIAIDSTSPYSFTVTMVPNSGAYGISTWWYYGITGSNLSNLLTQNSARLTDLEVVDNGSGSARFTCIMVSNTGANSKAWGWIYNASSTDVNNLVGSTGRLVDLEQYTLNGNTYYACVVIANSGRDARGWWYYYGVSQTTLNSLLSTNNARIYDLDRVSGGYNVVMLAQGSQKNWRYYGLTATQLTNQLMQIGARAIDIERYFTLSGYRYDVVMINNSNALSTRISEILRSTTDGHSGVYLKRANGSVLAYINGDRVHEPASTLKTLHHLQAMRAVQLGSTTLTTNYTTYTAGGGNSCPGGSSSPVSEDLQDVLGAMMGSSDNNRTRTITDNFGGFSSLNSRASVLGMTSTQVNHHIGCGTPANATTLRDIAHLHEQVVNGYLGSQRETFYELMRNDYETGGYAEGALFPVMTAEASSLGLTTAELAAFREDYYMAFKKGGYGTGAGFFRCWGGYVQIPFYQNGGVDLREYMVGSYVAEASNESNAINAAKFAAAEVLRDELRAALRTYRGYVPGSFASYGTGCAGSNGVPTHSATGTPELNQDIVYRLANAPARAPIVIYFGSSNSIWNGVRLPFDLGVLNAPGCALRTNMIAWVTQTAGSGGSWSLAARVPLDPQLLNLSIYSQYVVLDSSANRLGLTTSNGLRTRIGGRG